MPHRRSSSLRRSYVSPSSLLSRTLSSRNRNGFTQLDEKNRETGQRRRESVYQSTKTGPNGLKGILKHTARRSLSEEPTYQKEAQVGRISLEDSRRIEERYSARESRSCPSRFGEDEELSLVKYRSDLDEHDDLFDSDDLSDEYDSASDLDDSDKYPLVKYGLALDKDEKTLDLDKFDKYGREDSLYLPRRTLTDSSDPFDDMYK
jgi:hypothetical protein